MRLGINYGVYMILPVIGYGFYKTVSAYPLSVNVRLDTFPASSIRKEMEQKLKSLALKVSSKLSPYTLRALLKEKFPLIEHVGLSYKTPTALYIRIITQKPLALINGIHILTRTGNIVPAKLYAPSSYCTIPCIQTNILELSESRKNDLLSFAKQLPPETSDEYIFTFRDKTAISAICKKQPFLQLTLNQWSLKEEATWNALALLKEKIEHRYRQSTQNKKGPHASWCVDMRYTDRLILSQQRG